MIPESSGKTSRGLPRRRCRAAAARGGVVAAAAAIAAVAMDAAADDDDGSVASEPLGFNSSGCSSSEDEFAHCEFEERR